MTWPRSALVLAVGILAHAGPAQATLLVRSNSNGLFVQDKNGLNDTVRIVGNASGWRVTNSTFGDVFAFDRQAGCVGAQGDDRSSICERNVPDIRVELGAGADSLIIAENTITSNGILLAGSGDDFMGGQPGKDDMGGADGNDSLIGKAGNDLLRGGDGNDQLTGDVGSDTVRGEDGADSLSGDIGSDRLEGGAGSDILFGGFNNDDLFGGSGNDQLVGGTGGDAMEGDSGNDILSSKEEGPGQSAVTDALDCGTGFDNVFADLQDLVPGSCEEVERSPVGETPHVRLPRRAINVSAAGVGRVRARCPSGATIGCRGRMSLRLARRGVRRPARTRYAIRPGRSALITVRLSAREAPRVRGRIRGILTSLERGKLGPKTTIRRPLLR